MPQPMRRAIGRGWLAAAILVSGVAHGADLIDVYQMALDNDPTYQSARESLEAARQKVPEALSALLPAIGATASYGLTEGHTSYTGTPLVGRTFGSDAWTVQLTQPLLRVQYAEAYDQSRAIAEQAAAQFRGAEEDLILRVSQAYFDILVAKEALAAAEAQLKSTEEQVSAAQHGYDNGTVAVTDVYEARAQAEQARSQKVTATDDLESKQAALEAIIGSVPPALAALKDDANAPRPNPDQVDTWMVRAKQDNPAVQAARAAVKAAQSEVNKAQFQRMPTIDIVASIGRNYSTGNINNPFNYATNASDRQVGLQLSMPILDGGGMQAVVREAKANERKAEADLETARRKSAADARDAYAGVVNDLVQVEALRVAVTSGDSSVTGNQVGYRLGIRINTDVLNAQQQLFASKRDLAKARYDILMQGLKLKAAVGELTPEDVFGVNQLLSASGSQAAPVVAMERAKQESRERAEMFRLDQKLSFNGR